jgi:PTH1 family peptidyl-tRNA hydrolase
MKLIVGLGNPGGEYESTRHNIGFMVVEKLAKELGEITVIWDKDAKHESFVAKTGEVILVKPQTFMNRSGAAVKGLVDYYKLDPADVWIIHDDIDLPIGKIRIRGQGASGGHNGVDSIIKALNTDKFVRFRLGTGRGKESTGLNADKRLHHRSVINYVLSRFRQSEAGSFKHLVKNGTEAVRIALTSGLDKAMNRFN